MTLSMLAFFALVAALLAVVGQVLHARPSPAGAPSTPIAARPWPTVKALARLRSQLVRFVARRLAEEALAEDITQEVLLVIVSKWRSYAPGRGRNALRRWAFGIARTTIIDRRRALTTQRAFKERAALAFALRAIEHDQRDTARPFEARDLLRKLHAEMDPARWALWFAHVAEGYTAEEIARREGVAPTTIETRIRAAREEVARVLAGLSAEGSGS